MIVMMTSANDDKSDICQFFYQDLFHIVNLVYDTVYFFTAGPPATPPPPSEPWEFKKSPAQVRLINSNWRIGAIA